MCRDELDLLPWLSKQLSQAFNQMTSGTEKKAVIWKLGKVVWAITLDVGKLVHAFGCLAARVWNEGAWLDSLWGSFEWENSVFIEWCHLHVLQNYWSQFEIKLGKYGIIQDE